MSYIINKSDGNTLATVADGQIDQLSSSLTLVGKNYSGFGEYINENFVKLLENFSSTTQPTSPISGQLWYDTTEQKLKVYNGLDFVSVGTATISVNQPLSLGAGDLWFNDRTNQLFFYDGTTLILVAPIYTELQKETGFRVQTSTDTLGLDHTIALMYCGGNLLGIFSKDQFRPSVGIVGFPDDTDIQIGFTPGTLIGVKWNGTALNSEKLNNKSSTSYFQTDVPSVNIQGSISSTNNNGYTFGDSLQAKLYLDGSGDLIFQNDSIGKRVKILARSSGTQLQTAIEVNPLDQVVSVFPNNAESTALIGGNLQVNGNLTVLGDTTTVNTATLTVEDKLIEIAKVASPTDDSGDQGGIALKGTTDHIIMWSKDGAAASGGRMALASRAWNFSEHINLDAGKSLKIGGVEVLNGNTLSAAITNAPGLTSFGTFTSFTVDDIFINDNEITTRFTNTDLILNPAGVGAIRVAGSEIKEVKYTYDSFTNTVTSPSAANDAAPKAYVDYAVGRANLGFSMDISDPLNPGAPLSNGTIATYIEKLFPVAEHQPSTKCRVLTYYYSNTSETFTFTSEISKSFSLVVTGVSPTTTGTVLSDLNISPLSLPTPDIVITRLVKEYAISSGVWTWQQDLP